MVTLNRIYTKTGDKGDTGWRRHTAPKHNLRRGSGTVDEANAVLGLARLHAGRDGCVLTASERPVDLGADLAVPESDRAARTARSDTQVDRLEREIDMMNAVLPLGSFVLPGVTAVAAHLHHGRTVAGGADDHGLAGARVSGAAIRYINRLSDHLFVAARLANDGGKRDVLWIPGANR